MTDMKHWIIEFPEGIRDWQSLEKYLNEDPQPEYELKWVSLDTHYLTQRVFVLGWEKRDRDYESMTFDEPEWEKES